jgi:hypothetical protein
MKPSHRLIDQQGVSHFAGHCADALDGGLKVGEICWAGGSLKIAGIDNSFLSHYPGLV